MKKIFLLFFAIFMLTFSSCSAIIEWYWDMRGRSEEGRRETYEETKSYNEGKEQDLLKYRLEYLQADEEVEREAIASTIRLMYADYDESKLNPELRDFVKMIKYGEEF